MDHLPTILIAFLVFCVCMILYKLVSKGEKKLKDKQKAQAAQQAQSRFTLEQNRFLQTVGTLFKENKAMTLMQVYEACGMPHEIAYSRDSALIEEHIPFVKGEGDHNVFSTYAMALSRRFALLNYALVEHPNDVLQINLHKDESIYHVIYNVVLYHEKTTVTNVAYTGYKWSSGPLRMGNLSLMTNEITRMTPMDAGKLIFTNQRLIFIGGQKNISKQVKLSDILFCNLYQDGVMVNIPNHKPLVFKFPEHKDWEIYEISDGINEFAIVYDRLRTGNYKDNLIGDATPSIPSSASNEDYSQILADKNYDALIGDIIKKAVKGETVSTSSFQRAFAIGYNRAGKIMDQLESLGMVSPFNNGKREWLISANETELIKTILDSASAYPA